MFRRFNQGVQTKKSVARRRLSFRHASYILTLLVSPLALTAFMSGYIPGGFGWHGKITRQALEELGFSQRAIRAVRRANAEQDWDLVPLRIIDHRRHFGRDFNQSHEEAFKRNKEYLEGERTRFLAILADSEPDYSEARLILGYSIHTVQDAFSHTNYWQMSEADQEIFMKVLAYPDVEPPTGTMIVCSGSDSSDRYAYGHLDHGKDSPCTPDGKEAFYISLEGAVQATMEFVEVSKVMLVQRIGEAEAAARWEKLAGN